MWCYILVSFEGESQHRLLEVLVKTMLPVACKDTLLGNVSDLLLVLFRDRASGYQTLTVRLKILGSVKPKK
jgi:hypothetical protein